MASGQTTNYNLNQWEAGDHVLRTEFNADNEKIDGALAGLDGRLEALGQALEQDAAVLEAANAAWADKMALHLLQTATLSSGGDNFRFSLAGVEWSKWKFVHLLIEPKVKGSQGCSLYLDGGSQLLSLQSDVLTHIVLYPWYHGDWPFRGFYLTGGFGYIWDPHLFQNIAVLILAKNLEDYPLLAGCRVTIYGEQ